MESSDGS